MQITENHVVFINYTLKDDDGKVLDQSDDGKMQALLEQLQDTENGIFQDARSAGINSDISLILDQRFASKSTIFERMAGN